MSRQNYNKADYDAERVRQQSSEVQRDDTRGKAKANGLPGVEAMLEEVRISIGIGETDT